MLTPTTPPYFFEYLSLGCTACGHPDVTSKYSKYSEGTALATDTRVDNWIIP